MSDMQCALQQLQDRVEDLCKHRTTETTQKPSRSSYTVEQVHYHVCLCDSMHVGPAKHFS